MKTSKTPKYQTIKAAIQDWAFQGKIQPGERIPTELQLADQFGVSRQTVRMAINDLVHDRVLVSQQGRGTFLSPEFLNPQRVSDSHRMVAVITTYIADYIFPSIIRGIESTLSTRGYTMVLMSTDNDFQKEAQALDKLLTGPIDGVIVEPTRSTLMNPNLSRYLTVMGRKIPMVTLHSTYVELGLPCVRMDDEAGGFVATRHLLQRGHERVAILTKADDTQGVLRLRGHLRALSSQGTPIVEEWVKTYETGQEDEAADHFVQHLLNARDRATALVCYNDVLASRVFKALAVHGIRVPDDLALVSFDDSTWAEDHHVTSIVHPKAALGRAAAERILQRIEAHGSSEVSAEDVVLAPELKVRTSTAKMQTR